MFFILKELTKAMRFFQSETVLCEGVTFTQFCILDFVAQKGVLELSELRNLLSVEKSTLTRLVNPLVKRKLIKRINSTRDSRVQELNITNEGRNIHEKVWQCVSEFISNVLAQFPGNKEDVFKSVQVLIRSIYCCCSDCSCKI